MDGRLVESDACGSGAPIAPSDEPIKLGARSGTRPGHVDGDRGSHSEFRGQLDEVMLFSRALHESEVAHIYKASYRGQDSFSGTLGAPTVPSIARLPEQGRTLVGFWPLDGDGHDFGPHGFNGAVTNAEWAVGRYGFAFRFDGDDQLMVADAPGLDPGTLTALAWVKPSTFDFDADAGIIFNKERSWEVAISNDVYSDRDPWSLVSAWQPCWRFAGTVRMSLHEWTAIGAAFDGNSQLHYVNGALMETIQCGSGGAVLPDSDRDLLIGARGDCTWGACHDQPDGAETNSQFKGDIDEAMLFATVLSPRDVESVHIGNYRVSAGGAGH
eukprot:SAG31_NODE_197_length_20660_cov_8.861368_12_plen_327_part_00